MLIMRRKIRYCCAGPVFYNQLYSSRNFDSNIKTHTHKHTQETRTQTYAHKQQKLAAYFSFVYIFSAVIQKFQVIIVSIGMTIDLDAQNGQVSLLRYCLPPEQVSLKF